MTHEVSADAVNLLQQDSDKVVNAFMTVHNSVFAPLVVLVGVGLIYYLIGWPVLVGLSILLLAAPIIFVLM